MNRGAISIADQLDKEKFLSLPAQQHAQICNDIISKIYRKETSSIRN
ncbi:MAG: hypothetical protein IKG61_01515 [Selenomonadaceae bacterium]|nr:hypothetical protein [Selenomonadaceae bacterium]